MHDRVLLGKEDATFDRPEWTSTGANDVSILVKNWGDAATDSFKFTLIQVAKLTVFGAVGEIVVHETSPLSVASLKLRNTLALGGVIAGVMMFFVEHVCSGNLLPQANGSLNFL
jgi:hypothetical protein